jgi:hypothetical protein
MDANGREWTRMDANGREWTRMDAKKAAEVEWLIRRRQGYGATRGLSG